MMSDCSTAVAVETMGIDGSCKQVITNSHECNGPTLSAQTSLSSPAHSRKLEKTMEALSLVSVRALCALVLWYLFSFGAIFLNKYVVDMLNAEMIIFSSIHFLCGSVMGLINIYWPCDPLATHSTSIHPHSVNAAPKDLFNRSVGFFKSIALVGLMRFFVILLGLISFKYVAVSFVETIKSSAPLFTALISYIILKEKNGIFVQLSLIPIMFGLVLCTAYELSFTLIGFAAAIGTNIAECLQFVLSKLSLGGSEQHRASPAEFQFYTCSAAFLFHLPASLFLLDDEQAAQISLTTAILMFINGLLYHCQTMMAWSLMQFLSPLTHSVCNTVKCALAMWLSIPLFHNPVTLLGTLGSIIVVFGVLLYNKARDYERRLRHSAPNGSLQRLSNDILEI